MTTAFNAASCGRMKLNKNDYCQGKKTNSPCLRLEYTSDGVTKTAITDMTRGDISKAFTVFVINNPVYAKATGRNMGGYATRSAELYIEDVEVCKIPAKCEINYKYRDIKRKFGSDTPNLSNFFSSQSGLELVIHCKDDIEKCVNQVRIQTLLNDVTSKNILPFLETLQNQATVSRLMDRISECENLNQEDSVKYLIQIVEIMKQTRIKEIQSALAWITYKSRKDVIDERLSEFNTTGLSLRSSKKMVS